MTDEIVLFSGQIRTQRVRVWLEDGAEGISLLSHDIGPMLERAMGSDEIETYLVVANAQRPALAKALGTDVAGITSELARRYDGDSMATTNFRRFLEAHGIPYEFHIV